MDSCNHRPGSLARFELLPLRTVGDGAGDGARAAGARGVAGARAAACRAPAGSSLGDMFDAPPGALQAWLAATEPPPPPAPAPAAATGDAPPPPPPPPVTWALGLRLGAPVRAGAQVIICYGPKPNTELASAYGFVLRGNPADVVRVALQQQLLPLPLPSPPHPPPTVSRPPHHPQPTAWSTLRLAVVGAVGEDDAGWVPLGEATVLPRELCDELVAMVLRASGCAPAEEPPPRRGALARAGGATAVTAAGDCEEEAEEGEEVAAAAAAAQWRQLLDPAAVLAAAFTAPQLRAALGWVAAQLTGLAAGGLAPEPGEEEAPRGGGESGDALGVCRELRGELRRLLLAQAELAGLAAAGLA
jgi:hypothetical protein